MTQVRTELRMRRDVYHSALPVNVEERAAAICLAGMDAVIVWRAENPARAQASRHGVFDALMKSSTGKIPQAALRERARQFDRAGWLPNAESGREKQPCLA